MSSALFQNGGSVSCIVRFAVERPLVESGLAATDLAYHKRNHRIRFWGSRANAKGAIVPRTRRGLYPARLAATHRVFDHDPHPFGTMTIFRCAENPDSGSIHFNDSVHALGST